MSYSYATAKNVLSETELQRILAVFLSVDDYNVDWEKATAAFGSNSQQSMKKMVQNSLKKIAEAGGKNGVVSASAVSETSAVQTPKKQTPKGRKRKAAADTTGDSDDEALDTPKSLRKKAVKNIKREVDEEDDEDEQPPAKAPGTPKTPKTPKNPRKTKAVKQEEVDDDEEETRDTINVASKKPIEEGEEDEEV